MSNLLHEEEIGRWRRSHYSSEIDPSFDNKEVIIMGWVSSIRDHGNIRFLMIKDRDGFSQVVAKKNECSANVLGQIQQIKEQTSLAVRGTVRSQDKAPNGVEVVPLELKVFSLAKKTAPFMVQSKSSVGIDTRLDLRALDLRRSILQSVFHIRHTVLEAVRQFLSEKGFIEVNTPKIIATSTEGGAALFPIFYYDKEAFLAQSPQLYKEQLTLAFESVYEIGPIFRAEPSRTNRHLSESVSIDVEKAFVDYNDMMALLGDLILSITYKIREKNNPDLMYLGCQLPDIVLPIPKYSYSHLVEQLGAAGQRIKWGDDISPQVMKNLHNDNFKGFYFITDWPTSVKPFYVKPNSEVDAGKVSESFDLMYGPLEISSGSTRINRKSELLERMQKQGLNTKMFDYHLKVFDYGVPPHAGFGIGLERLLMALIKLDNIRDAAFYPRDIDRLSP